MIQGLSMKAVTGRLGVSGFTYFLSRLFSENWSVPVRGQMCVCSNFTTICVEISDEEKAYHIVLVFSYYFKKLLLASNET